MLKIGQYNQLVVVKRVDFGVYLDGYDAGEILLPNRFVPESTQVGDRLRVFIYFDSDDTLIATTQRPRIQVGQCAFLKVVDVNAVGAFLDWGLMKDLLVPYSEQHKPFELGRSYVVTAFCDAHTGRILASSKLPRHLKETAQHFKPLDPVDLLVFARSEMGYKAVINHKFQGLIFRDDAFKPLAYGEALQGYIKNVRADGKIDVLLQKPAGLGRQELTEQILQALQQQGGTLLLTDKSPPADIYAAFNVSKANYKKALGALLKQNKIVITPERITLVP
jgi:uncharacterized protein